MPPPVIPPEGTYSDIEHDFIENEPPGLFPTDQNSYWGQARKVFTDHLQALADKMSQWYLNLDPATVNEDDMPEWEYMLEIPDGTGKTLEDRRAFIEARFERGPFTRTRRAKTIERFIEATFGLQLQFDPDGIPFSAGGMPFFSGSTSLAGTYRVYEDIRNFVYEVWIASTVTPDLVGLTRELDRITPAHLGFTIDNTHANVLNYHRTVRAKSPVAYYRLNGLNATDESGFGNDGVINGGGLAVAAPGLLDAAVQHDLAGAVDGAFDFDGVDDYITVADNAKLDVGDSFSLEVWVQLDDFNRCIMDKGANSFLLRIGSSGHPILEKSGVGMITQVVDPYQLLDTEIYHVVAVKSGSDIRLYVNGVDRTHPVDVFDLTVENNALPLQIGRKADGTEYFDGRMDEIAIYKYPLTAAQVLDNYNVGKNIAV